MVDDADGTIFYLDEPVIFELREGSDDAFLGSANDVCKVFPQDLDIVFSFLGVAVVEQQYGLSHAFAHGIVGKLEQL